MGKLTDKLFHHDQPPTSSETALPGPAVLPIPPLEDLHPKPVLTTIASTSPSQSSLLQKIKDKVFHHDTTEVATGTTAVVKPVESTTVVTPATTLHGNSDIKEHSIGSFLDKVLHPHPPPTGSLIHPFEKPLKPLEVHTLAETHHFPAPLTTHASSKPASIPVIAVPIPVPVPVPVPVIVEENIEVAIVPEATIPGEVSVPSIDEISHVYHPPSNSLEGTSEAHPIPTTSSTTVGVKRKLHQD